MCFLINHNVYSIFFKKVNNGQSVPYGLVNLILEGGKPPLSKECPHGFDLIA